MMLSYRLQIRKIPNFLAYIPSASNSRMNTVEPTPLPSAHQNNLFPPRTDLNTLDYALVNNTLQLCQQVIAGVPKQTNKYNLHSAMNFNPGPGSTLPVNQNTFGVQNPTLGEFANPNQMNFPNSFVSQVPIFSMQNQQMQMTKHGYPATAFSGVDMVSPEIRTKIISDVPSTPINIDQLERELLNHPDRHFVNFLCNSLRNGFDMLVSDVNLPIYECKNSLTARKNPEVVTNLLQQEVDKGFLKGPFSQPPFLSYRVSPLGIATHKYSKKQRLIIDLSSPHNLDEHYSVNDLIDKDLCSLTYIKIDDAINAIQRYGSKSLCCKVDISDAFKQLPIKKEQWHLFCVKWNGQYYHYVRLPFGCRSSPRLFDSLSTSVCWIAQNNYDIKVIFHLLDDFLTVDKPSDCGERTMALLSLIFNKLNIPLSCKKTVGPVCELEYLGIILDKINMQARLPLDKVERITQFNSFVLR
ncbi:Hypothetical predicted protein [Mytilus galloprovincialis]|uniref:Reverse transcriptase domain-containing protein n=1 Tax=Mytilus galloprovincialis TaxID=29158 RepID=A0A8B6CDH8_MYTGA|nr:Hypothetical predicted protein [Mytilus galloprovincialis]